METIVSSLPDRYVRLRDGRRLAYAEYGDPQGKPIFFFHGTPGSRLFHHPDDSLAASAGARIIAVDRPGFGRSDFKFGRTLLDWPNDVVQLADALHLQRFAVMGFSGGGPYAAACASSIPDRVTAAGLVSSMAPLDNPDMIRGMQGMTHMFFSLERHVPPLARAGCWLMCTTWRSNPDLYFRSQMNGLSNSDEAQALLPRIKAMLTADILEAISAGTQGVTYDLEILARPWGFYLHVIATNVLLWHGESDTQAPVIMGKRLASAIPHCRATFFPGEGHRVIYTHGPEILRALVESEAVTREVIQPAAMGTTTQDSHPSSEVVALPESPDSAIVDASVDSSQGLQPVRTVLEAIREASVSPKPEQMSGASRPAYKKTARGRSAAIADKPAKVKPEPEPAPEVSRPASNKTARGRSVAVADKPARASAKVKPEPEKAKSTAVKTAKHSAAVAASARDDGSKSPKRPMDKAKTSANRPARPRAAAIKPLPVYTAEGPQPEAEPAEATSKKPSSGRKSAKEAVLV